VVLGTGIAPGISNVMVRAVADRLGGAGTIETALLLSASDASGPASFDYFLEELAMPFMVHIDGEDRPKRAFSQARAVAFPAPIGTRRAYLPPWTRTWKDSPTGSVPSGPDTWEVLAAQTARLRRLADDIALVSRAEEHQLPLQQVAVAPSQIVTAAVRAARPSYDSKGVRLTARLADDLPELTADPERLTQVVDGLLSNAPAPHPSGWQVTVTTRAAGPHVQIAVADTGEAIAAEHLPHIFERFYRADPARDRAHGGSGIGLTIARALIAAQGGTLTAASDGPGTGAGFAISLPVSTSH
jgi:signal transduction histidine kinase